MTEQRHASGGSFSRFIGILLCWTLLFGVSANAIIISEDRILSSEAAVEFAESNNASELWIDDDEWDKSNETALQGGVIVSRPIDTSTTADSILFPWFVQLLGCCAIFILTRFQIPIPYAAVMFGLGALMGYGAVRNPNLENDSYLNQLLDSIILWTNIDSATLLLIFLPGLIFKDAVEIPINLFLVAAGQIWILAFPMVLVGTALTGLAANYCLPYQMENPESFGPWSWIVLGAILASTDPIAVASVLKTAGASPRLVMHISGESLMNDGSSYVFFQIAVQLWYASVGLPVQNDIGTWGTAIPYFIRMSAGGTFVGIIFGFALLGVLWELDRRMEREFDIVQVVFGLATAYLCYYVCDQILNMSGVIATVACGVVVNQFGRGLIQNKDMMSSYLALADFLLNTLLFALGGTIWAAISFSTQQSSAVRESDWGLLFVFYFLCIIIRFVQVGMFYPILSRIGLKSNWKEGVFLAYSGLHGSVGVALGLSLIQYVFQNTTNQDIRDAATILQFLGGGATLLTLTINGTTAATVLKILGLVKPPVPVDHTRHVFEGAAKDFVYNEVSKLFQEQRFQHVSFEVLKEHVPFVIKEPPKRDTTLGTHNQEDSIQKFHGRVVGEGKPFISLLNATKRVSETVGARLTETQKEELELAVEMRQIFLELLQEAYKVEAEMGELDHHNGYLYDALMQSADLAINEVRYDEKPIEDWKHTDLFFRWKERSDSLSKSSITQPSAAAAAAAAAAATAIARLQAQQPVRQPSRLSLETTTGEVFPTLPQSIASIGSSVMSDDGSHQQRQQRRETKKTQVGVKRMKLDVLRALAFMHAHKLAEAKLQLYVNRFDDELIESMDARHSITEKALQRVLEESRQQVCLAEKMLQEEVCDEDLEIILSHYCAKILVRRLITFTDKKSKEGMIGKKETRVYRRRMKQCIHRIETQTIHLLTESVVKTEPSQLENNPIPHHVLESLCEYSIDSYTLGSPSRSPCASIHEEDTKTMNFETDLSNADTIGASNVKQKGPPPTPLSVLFEVPFELKDSEREKNDLPENAEA